MTASLLATPPPGRLLFGYAFAPEVQAGLIEAVVAPPVPHQGVRLVVTANLDHVVQLRHDARLQRAYANAWRRTIDGWPVFLYAWLRGAGVPARITGADLLPEILDRLTPGAHRPFFVAADEQIAAGLRDWAAQRGFSAGDIATDVPPFGFERDDAYSRALAERIRAHGATQLFLGLGCPKSEVWIDENRARLGDLYAFAVGAALGFFVGTQHRAPRFMRRFGLEWLHRVSQEPRRLGGRYFIQSWAFLAALVNDIRVQRRGGGR